MFRTLRASLYAIGLAAGLALLAVLAVAMGCLHLLGQSATEAQAARSVVADVLPPPLYLVETRLLLSQAMEGSLTPAAARTELQRLQQQHRRQLAHWATAAPEALKPLLANDIAASAEAVFEATAPLLQRLEQGDATGARAALATAQARYTEHRRAVDATVAVGEQVAGRAVSAFESTRRSGQWLLALLALVFIVAAALSYLRGLQSILGPVRDCVELAHRVAEGDLQPRPLARRHDELGELQTALGRMTERLATNRQSLLDARDAAEAGARAKADFLANMSHELRTPMNAVIGLTRLVLRTTLTTRQRDYLQKIDTSGRSLLRIINDILDFSKIDAGRLELELAPLALDKLLDEVCTELATQIGNKPLELIVRRDEAVPDTVEGDALRLKQVLLNLASNAVKFTAEGEVAIEVGCQDGETGAPALVFTVSDTGMGMEDAMLGRLFQAFSQADSSTTRQFGGTGLGLAISQRLVRLMGGRMTVDSRPGRGSVFSFSLPLRAVRPDAVPVPLDQAAAVRSLVRGLDALVVDDNHTARRTLASMLRSFGMNVTEEATGHSAIEAARRAQAQGRRFALALVDWRMPGVDGFEVIDALRRFDSMSSASYIMVSAYDREQVEGAMPELPPEGVMQKPVTRSTLLDMLYTVLARQRTAESAPLPERAWPRLDGLVLLVEDNEINQLVGLELLESLGLGVRVADDGRQALAQLAELRFDAVVMDLQMPGMDGLAATERIRALPGYASTPIIAMTASCLEGERERCLAAGMSDYIAKPVDPDVLADCMARWLPARP